MIQDYQARKENRVFKVLQVKLVNKAQLELQEIRVKLVLWEKREQLVLREIQVKEE